MPDTPRDMFGTTFTWNSGSVGLITDIKANITNEFLETTNFGSSNGTREFIGGPKDGGTIEITFHADPSDTDHAALTTDANTHPTPSRAWSIDWSGIGSTWSGNGLIEDLEYSGSFEDTLQGSLTIKVTGQITVA